MEKEKLTLKALDDLVAAYVRARSKYDRAKTLSNAREKKKYEAEMRLVEALRANGKKSYSVTGLGLVSRREKFSVRVPTGDAKRAFFEYLQKRGEDVFYTLATVNYQSLNSFYVSEMEAAEAKGVFPFVLPGIEEPVSNEGITFRKEVPHGKSSAQEKRRNESGNRPERIGDTF
jgi:hypothetical protein